MFKGIACASAVAATFLSSCSTIEVRTASDQAQGLVYSLPKGQVLLTAQRKTVTDKDADDAQKKSDDAAEAQKAIDAALKTAQGDEQTLESQLAVVDAAGKDDLSVKVSVAKALVIVLKAKQKAQSDEAASLKAKAATMKAAVGTLQESAELKLLPVAPSNERYIAKLDHMALRDDTFSIGVENGLLNTTSVASTDQTPNIVIAIASSIVAFPVPVNIPKSAYMALPKGAGLPADPCPEYSIAVVFDPTNWSEVKKADDLLATASGLSPDLRLLVTDVYTRGALPPQGADQDDPQGSDQDQDASGITLDDGQSSAREPITYGNEKAPQHRGADRMVSAYPTAVKEGKGGLVYRTQTSVSVYVQADTNAGHCKLKSYPDTQYLNATMPDSRERFLLPVKASPFVKTTYDYGFKDGMPTSQKVSRPSEILGLVQIPVGIAKAIVSVPADILKLRVDYDSSEVSRAKAQVDMLNQQLEQIKTQNSIKDLQSK